MNRSILVILHICLAIALFLGIAMAAITGDTLWLIAFIISLIGQAIQFLSVLNPEP